VGVDNLFPVGQSPGDSTPAGRIPLSTDVPVPVNPTPKPKAARERGKDHQLEAVAQLATMGTPAGTMAAVTGLSEGYINRLLTDKRNETFNKLHDSYLEKNLKTLVGARFELADKIGRALEVFGEAMEAPDIRLRKEMATWLWDKTIPDLNKDKGGDSSDIFQVVINQPQVQTAIHEGMSIVADSLLGLREAIASQTVDAHMLVGTAALPIPPGQREVSEGEAPLEPTEGPEDLLTELVEREDGN